MKTRKIIAFVLIGISVIALVFVSPVYWVLGDSFAPGVAPSTVWAALGRFLPGLGTLVVLLAPLWIIGVWLLWTARPKKASKVTFANTEEAEPGMWPPPPQNPGT